MQRVEMAQVTNNNDVCAFFHSCFRSFFTLRAPSSCRGSTKAPGALSLICSLSLRSAPAAFAAFAAFAAWMILGRNTVLARGYLSVSSEQELQFWTSRTAAVSSSQPTLAPKYPGPSTRAVIPLLYSRQNLCEQSKRRLGINASLSERPTQF